MIITVASGKGGTGKTTVTSSLVATWDTPVTAVDLDVEEPNLHLFLEPELGEPEKAYMAIPLVDEAKCTHCGKCSDLCQFKAINALGSVIMTFPEMCHGCGGCLAICPDNALSPGKRELGTISRGKAGQADYFMGRLRVGEAMSPPLMRQVKARLSEALEQTPGDAILDAPPGVSCPAVCAVMDSDFVLLVTEPTPFGFHDFKLAYEAFSPFGKPMGAVINRAGQGFDEVHDFCRDMNLPILAEIPYDRAIAEAYSRGELVADVSDEYNALFGDIRGQIRAAMEAANA